HPKYLHINILKCMPWSDLSRFLKRLLQLEWHGTSFAPTRERLCVGFPLHAYCAHSHGSTALNRIPSNSPKMTRRHMLKTTGKAGALLAASSALSPFLLSGCGGGGSGDKIKVGILHSLTGTMAISEKSLNEVEKMAIEEINASGGVLGKQIEPVEEDPES